MAERKGTADKAKDRFGVTSTKGLKITKPAKKSTKPKKGK